MPTYIALLKWTQQGLSRIKDSASRLDAGRAAFKTAGIDMKDVFLTMGRYDLICVLEAPDDDTLARGVLTLGSQGNVSTETLKAFTEDQYRKIIGSL
ncbi:MAG TPA: GYD domain-containing protein [Pyrinomonadaceae bacterium]|nr:GYD domain-containing protein [Pyrinomonadaceae bacterium]